MPYNYPYPYIPLQLLGKLPPTGIPTTTTTTTTEPPATTLILKSPQSLGITDFNTFNPYRHYVPKVGGGGFFGSSSSSLEIQPFKDLIRYVN